MRPTLPVLIGTLLLVHPFFLRAGEDGLPVPEGEPVVEKSLDASNPPKPLAATLLPPVGGDAWRPLVLPRVEKHTEYDAVQVDGRHAVRSRSECSASGLAVSLDTDAFARTPVLRWRWRVEQAVDVADEQTREGDDFSARVYVLFRFEPERAAWTARARQSAAELVAGEELPGNALNYVWTSRVPRGESWQNPFADQARMISMGPAAPGVWRQAQVDVHADYVAQFGSPPPETIGLAIMTDSDNGCSRASALFSDFALSARPGQ